MKKLNKIAFIFFFLTHFFLFAQNSQSIRGLISDKESKYPLIGVTVVVSSTDPIIGTTTNEFGEFKLQNVPIGRHVLSISYIGYKPQTVPNIVVSSGKETILDFQLEENVIETNEVVINGYGDKTATNNQMAVISARSFNLEEAQRYAGSLNDPARMAANYAGVSGTNDNRNDIVIRGNSPLGLLWRLEGIEIPNPNHFGALGATGGPISMLNSNQLAKSDFFTGAFTSNFGNANSGVFDLQMRRGNNEKREHLLQIGFNGLEAGTEGYFSKKSKVSYLINYRYSTLGILDALGMNLGTGGAVPQYQDVNFKVDIPTQKKGKFVVFGIGGMSNISLLDSNIPKIDTNDAKKSYYNNGTQDIKYQTRMGIIGFSHTYFFNPNTYLKTVVANSGVSEPTIVDSVIRVPTISTMSNYEGNFSNFRSSINMSLNKKFDRKNVLNFGFNVDRISFVLKDRFNKDTNPNSTPNWQDIRNSTGSNYLIQAWIQHQHKFTERFMVNYGLHSQYFTLNTKSFAIEPRLGTRYQLSEKLALNGGLGLHNQTQMQFLYYQKTYKDGLYTETNKNLGFTSSAHAIAGIDYNFKKDWRLKIEAYYQNIYNAAVETRPSYFSSLNIGGDFSIPNKDSLINNGRGYNYGIEFTLEKFFANGFYLLQTTSIFTSKYKGSDDIWRNTAFNGGYVINLLGGFEQKISKKFTLVIDTKGTLAGGRRTTPIDLTTSRANKRTEFDYIRAYEDQFPFYFRTDLKIGFRIEGKKVTQQFSLSLQNITNHVNAFNRVYNSNVVANSPQEVKINPQLGFLIIPQYRILF